jgi:hypothetical protein
MAVLLSTTSDFVKIRPDELAGLEEEDLISDAGCPRSMWVDPEARKKEERPKALLFYRCC